MSKNELDKTQPNLIQPNPNWMWFLSILKPTWINKIWSVHSDFFQKLNIAQCIANSICLVARKLEYLNLIANARLSLGLTPVIIITTQLQAPGA